MKMKEDRNSSDSQHTKLLAVEDEFGVMDEINKGKWRHRHLRKHFEELPENEICISDFTCALLQKGLLRQGRLYFTQEYCCFHSPIGNTKFVIHVSEIARVVPRCTLMIPTALNVDTKDGRSYSLKSFLFRGNALNSFATIMQAWKKKCANHPSSFDMKESDEIAGIPTTAHSRVKSGAAMKNIAPKETQVLKMITLSMIVFVGMNVFMLLKSTYVAFL